MECKGPCLPHCYRCSPCALVLAHLSLVYLGACIGYLARTRSMGTPFMDSLTDEQRSIKKQSALARRDAFVQSAVVTMVLLYIWSPFRRP